MNRARMHWIVFGFLRGWFGFVPRYREVVDLLDRLTPEEAQRIGKCQELEDRLLMSVHRALEAIADTPELPPQGVDPLLTTQVRTFWKLATGQQLSLNEARAAASALSPEEKNLFREALRQTGQLVKNSLMTRLLEWTRYA